MKHATLLFFLLIMILPSSCGVPLVDEQGRVSVDSAPGDLTGMKPHEDRSGCVIGPVPGELGLDSYYEKYCDAEGIPIVSSGRVEDRALQQAYYLITNILAPVPEVREELVHQGAYFAVLGITEELTMLPEYAHMNSAYWDARARIGRIKVPAHDLSA